MFSNSEKTAKYSIIENLLEIVACIPPQMTYLYNSLPLLRFRIVCVIVSINWDPHNFFTNRYFLFWYKIVYEIHDIKAKNLCANHWLRFI